MIGCCRKMSGKKRQRRRQRQYIQRGQLPDRKEESIHQNREEKSIRPIRRITAIRSMEKACMQNMEHMHHRNRSIRHRRIMTVLRSKKISSASTVEIQRAVFWRLWQTDSVLSAVKTICRGNMTFMWRRPRSADLI